MKHVISAALLGVSFFAIDALVPVNSSDHAASYDQNLRAEYSITGGEQYKNEDYNFSILIPEGWFFITRPSDDDAVFEISLSDNLEFIDRTEPSEQSTVLARLITVFVYENTGTQTLAQYVVNQMEKNKAEVLLMEDARVSGQRAVQVKYYTDALYLSAFVLKGDYVYSIESLLNENTDGTNEEEFFKFIVSNFKFVD